MQENVVRRMCVNLNNSGRVGDMVHGCRYPCLDEEGTCSEEEVAIGSLLKLKRSRAVLQALTMNEFTVTPSDRTIGRRVPHVLNQEVGIQPATTFQTMPPVRDMVCVDEVCVNQRIEHFKFKEEGGVPWWELFGLADQSL